MSGSGMYSSCYKSMHCLVITINSYALVQIKKPQLLAAACDLLET